MTSFLQAKPVMLKFDGTILEYLDPKNQTKVKGIGATSHVSDVDCGANAMVEFPKKYIKRWTDNSNIAHFRICNIKLDDDYKSYNWMYGTTEADAKEIDYIYLPMYKTSLIETKGRCLADQQVAYNTNGATELAAATNLGSGWDFYDWSDWNFIRDIFFLMGKSTDSQKHFGYGHSSTSSIPNTDSAGVLKTGGTKDVGPFFGGKTDGYMKFLWLENWYGDRNDRGKGL